MVFVQDDVALLFAEHGETAQEVADPESISVASCRVKIISDFVLIVFA